MRHTNGRRSVVLIAALLGSLAVQAGFWDDINIFRRIFPRRRVETLMVTGNVAKSRLLAELAQHRTKQPIVLVSPERGGRAELFFMPSVPEAMVFEEAKYAEFVDFLHPARIVILGDAGFVPERFVDAVRGKYPTVVFNSKDWVQNASALGVLLRQRNLARDFAAYAEKLDAAVGGQAVAPGALATPAAPPEPLITPQLMPPLEQPAP
ncbi:MAG: hypothetical protein JXR77_17010 [Lentisphaeria bacterium]|nr:hypothetical protein [Lentisphaeria bacterium]